MKRRIFPVLLASTLALGTLQAVPAMADGQKVVTLGADLTEEQRNAVLKYFGVYGKSIETIFITNQDERNHLASYVPLEQIGTKTFSCALVSPTSSGGIHVKTANLNWVTSNMIASTLSTSGVVNCDVLAASPFEVSGTGALTGVMMAYEAASGEQLDETKKELANQELVTTGTLANEVGQTQATNIVNEIKIQIIEGEVVDENEVSGIVDHVVEENTPSGFSPYEHQMLDELAQQIAQQQYNYDDMKETLERVEENVSQTNETVSEINENVAGIREDLQQQASGEADEEEADELQGLGMEEDEQAAEGENAAGSEESASSLAEDSILFGTDDSALGEGVNIDATDEEALPPEAVSQEEPADEEDPFVIVTGDDYSDSGEEMSQPTGDAQESADQAQENTPEEDPFAGQEEDPFAAEEEDPFAAQEEEAFAVEGEDPSATQEEDPFAAQVENPDAAAGEEQGMAEEEMPEDTPEESAENAEDSEEGAPASGELVINEIRILPNEALGDTDALGTAFVTVQADVAGLKPEEGTLAVYDDFGTEIISVDLADPAQVETQEMSADALASCGWSEGTVLRIHVGDAFGPDGYYRIELEGTFAKADTGERTAVSETASVSTGSDGILLQSISLNDLRAGVAVGAQIVTANEAAAFAEISSADESLAAIETPSIDLAQTDLFTINLLQAGKTDITADLYDADQNPIGTIVLTLRIF